MKECHNVPIVGDMGMCKTMELMDWQFYWRSIKGDTIQYVKTYPTCQLMRSGSKGKAGLLPPLEIPTKKWAHVTTNLVMDLPESDGYTTIEVFIDKLTNMVHFSHAKKKLMPWNIPGSSWTQCLDYMASQK